MRISSSWGTRDAAPSTRIWFPAVLVAICVMSAAVLLGVTRPWGLGVSPDSVAYLDAARSVRQGDGLTNAADQPLLYAVKHEHAPYPLLFWAPLYPVVLAGVDLGPWGAMDAARVLNAVLLAAIVALVGWLVFRTTDSRIASLLAAGALALSPVGLDLYSTVLSEPLFVFLSYGAIAFVACYLATERPLYFWGAALATGFALLARFAGVPLIAATAVPLLLYGGGGWRRRIPRAVGFAGLSVLPLVAWLIRNWHLTGSATGRKLGWHPLSAHRLVHSIDEFTMLLVPADVPAAVRGPLALAMVVAVVVAATRIRGSDLTRGFAYYLVVSLLVYLVLYPLFLISSISVADAVTNLSHRFLFPMYPGMVVLASWVLVIGFRSVATTRLVRTVFIGGIAVFLCGTAAGVAAQGRTIRRDGDGYSGRAWSESPAMAHIRALPPSTTIYSDRPDLIYFLTRRVARSVPATENPMTVEPNRNLATDNRTLRRHLSDSDLFVLFTTSDSRWYLEDPEGLEKHLGLMLSFRTKDAVFLRRAS